MSERECCVSGRDFQSDADVVECERHGYRGQLPCPWPECLHTSPEWRTQLGVLHGELATSERVWVRKKVAVSQPLGYARMYYWEERK